MRLKYQLLAAPETTSATPTPAIAVSSEVIRLGRDPGCEIALDPVRFPKVSGHHAKIEQVAGRVVLVHLSASNKTLLNDQPIEGAASLKPSDRIRRGCTGTTVRVLAIELTKIP